MTGGARDRRACPRTRRKTHFNAFAVSCFMSHETRATPDAYVCRMCCVLALRSEAPP
jgi:hypothetical protein